VGENNTQQKTQKNEKQQSKYKRKSKKKTNIKTNQSTAAISRWHIYNVKIAISISTKNRCSIEHTFMGSGYAQLNIYNLSVIKY
jgi:hypothetical protein